MTHQEQIEFIGKELLTLAGLQADIEQRVKGSKRKIESLQKSLDSEMDILQSEFYKGEIT